MIKNPSIWKELTPLSIQFPSLENDTKFDVLIIGAGITGITAAMQLIKAGKQVGIIEADKISQGTTGFSTANLYIPVQPFYRLLKMKFGLNVVRQVIESRQTAINFIENTIQENAINCNFIRRPLYFFTTDRKKDILIHEEVKTLLKAGVEIKAPAELALPMQSSYAARLDNQARFNPFQYIQALSAILSKDGCQLFENTPVTKIEETNNHLIVHTDKCKITAQQVIMATHIPKGIHKTHLLAYPYRSYAVAFRLKGNHYPNGNFWHFDLPAYAISTHNTVGNQIDLMIVAGNNHKTGHPKDMKHAAHFAKVKAYVQKNFEIDSFAYQWSAQHYQPADALPYIGLAKRKTQRLYIATGYHTDGLVYGTVAGLLLADLICGKENSWQNLYDANRFTPLASSLRFIKENCRVFVDYTKGYIKGAETKNLTAIKKSEGKIIKLNGKKCAAYRDEQGSLHLVSAICTHMYCTITWNDSEKSWDCPCHGSRFTVDGDIIEGPALTPLAKCQ